MWLSYAFYIHCHTRAAILLVDCPLKPKLIHCLPHNIRYFAFWSPVSNDTAACPYWHVITVFACLAQCIIYGSVRNIQQKQRNPHPTDVDLFMALQMAAAVWAATHPAVIEQSYENTHPLLQDCWFRIRRCQTQVWAKGRILGLTFLGIRDTITLELGTWRVSVYGPERALEERCCSVCGAELRAILQKWLNLRKWFIKNTAPRQCCHRWTTHELACR